MVRHPLPPRDAKLIQIVDAALAETARKSGEWLVCKKGCTQCCFGVFAINALDAARLRRGFTELKSRDPKRAARIQARAKTSWNKLQKEFTGESAGDFPLNPKTGALYEDDASQARFEELGNDEPCPVLSPETGECELYAHRPMTCRVFGPPIRTGPTEALGVCELCYHGATEEQIAACEMTPDPDDLEGKLLRQMEGKGASGETIIAWCLKD